MHEGDVAVLLQTLANADERYNALEIKTRALVEAVYRDNSTNGDITSRETIAAADALRMELDRWK